MFSSKEMVSSFIAVFSEGFFEEKEDWAKKMGGVNGRESSTSRKTAS